MYALTRLICSNIACTVLSTPLRCRTPCGSVWIAQEHENHSFSHCKVAALVSRWRDRPHARTGAWHVYDLCLVARAKSTNGAAAFPVALQQLAKTQHADGGHKFNCPCATHVRVLCCTTWREGSLVVSSNTLAHMVVSNCACYPCCDRDHVSFARTR